MNPSKARGSEALAGRAVSALKAIRPLHDNVLLKVLGRGGTEEQMEGSVLYKPAAAMDTTRVRGRVVAVGPGKLAYDAEAGTYDRKPMSVVPGQEVTFELGAGTLLRVDGREFLMVTDEQLTGVVIERDPDA
jgi:co-chaperonin GroES (HSP10)